MFRNLPRDCSLAIGSQGPGHCVFLTLFPVLFLALSGGAFAASQEAANGAAAFDWQEIPRTAILEAVPPFTSEDFRVVEEESDRICVQFKSITEWGKFPTGRDRSRFIVVAPSGGISSATFEFDKRLFMKEQDEVHPENPPDDPSGTKRLTFESLGEYRGAELVLVEFRQAVRPRIKKDADAIWIREATLTLRLAQPFSAPRPVSSLVRESLETVALNPRSIDRCLSSRNETGWVDTERLNRWKAPTLKIRTQEEGWSSISARQLLTEWGRGLQADEIRLYRRGSLVRIPEDRRAEGDHLGEEDIEETLFVVDSEGNLKEAGDLTLSDRVVFFARRSTAAFDPLECYWLTRESGVRSREPSLPTGAAELPEVTKSRRTVVIGEDREFVGGGLKNEEQEHFWVDRSFPDDASKALRIGLPDWTLAHPSPIEGKLRLLFPSITEQQYTPHGSIRSGSPRVEIDTREIPHTLVEPPSGYGWDACFKLPRNIEEATICVFHFPRNEREGRLQFDHLTLATDWEMSWGGDGSSTRVYGFPKPTTGVFVVSRTDTSPPPAFGFGRTESGRWVSLQAEVLEKEIRYRSAIPISDLHLLSGTEWCRTESIRRFSLPVWLEEPSTADQIVLSPKAFQTQVDLIDNLNLEKGFKTSRVDIEEVFDVFSGGQFSPFALRNYLTWVTLSHPDPQPASVLLVGDSSWDAWNRFPHGHEIPNWTPSYHPHRDPAHPSDLWFVEGVPDDKVPDWLWGRIPCQTIDHLEGYLTKRYAFEATPKTEWSRRLVWVSDDNSPVARNTRELFDQILPLDLRVNHIRIEDYPFVDNYYYGEHLERTQEAAREDPRALDYGKISPTCNQAVLDSLNEGCSLFVYSGHSGPNVLAHERVLFGGGSLYSDVPKLTNQGRAPLCMLMTCDVGRFDFAEMAKWSVGLTEELLFHRDGGCLAVVSSTGKGYPSDHQDFLLSALDALYNRGVKHSGVMVWTAKVRCLIPKGKNSTLDMFTLFGDPLFPPSLPPVGYRAEPERLRWGPDGSIEVEVRLFPQPGSGTASFGWVATCWQIGNRLTEDWLWKELPISEEGVVKLTLPDAREVEKLLLGMEIRPSGSGDAPPTGTAVAAIDLERLPAPDWLAGAGEGLPNLTLGPDDIDFESYTPRSGETTFIMARIHNLGEGPAEHITVEAYEGEEPVPRFAEFPPATIRRLLPGEDRSVRLRWDRWKGVGERTVTIKVDPEERIEESNEQDNQASKELRVLNKPDLAWGFVRDSTAGAVNFSLATPARKGWILQPDNANMGHWSPLRSFMKTVDRGAMLPVPLTNFGETDSNTCNLTFTYWAEGQSEPFPIQPTTRIPSVKPSGEDGTLSGKKVEVLLLPGLSRVDLEVDPEGLVDETDSTNNRLTIVLPKRFWENFPTLKPVELPENALEPIEPMK